MCKWGSSVTLSRFEEEDGDLTEIEIDEMLGLVGNVTAKVAANNAVPGWAKKINK